MLWWWWWASAALVSTPHRRSGGFAERKGGEAAWRKTRGRRVGFIIYFWYRFATGRVRGLNSDAVPPGPCGTGPGPPVLRGKVRSITGRQTEGREEGKKEGRKEGRSVTHGIDNKPEIQFVGCAVREWLAQ